MRYLQVIAVMTALSWTSSAWAQFGLYGSPNLVRLPKVESPAPPHHLAAPRAASVQPVAASLGAPPAVETASAKRPQKAAKKEPAAKKPGRNRPAKEHPPKPLPKQKPQQALPSVIDEMLGESGGPPPPPWGLDPGCAPDDPWFGYGACDDGAGCDDCGDPCLPCREPMWYVSLTGLVMGRGDRPNKVWTSYRTTDVALQTMHTGHEMDWRGGAEIRFGRRFCCDGLGCGGGCGDCGYGSWAIEAAYWTLDPLTSMHRRIDPFLSSTPLDFSDVVWDDGTLPGLPEDLFDSAREHRIWRRNEVHSVELSLIRHRMGCAAWGPVSCDWSLGPRFFRFEENLRFGSLDSTAPAGAEFGDYPAFEGYLDDQIVNNLVGAQFGCNLGYYRDGWRLYAAPRVGIYNNHIKHRFRGYRGDGERFAPAASTGYPPYPVESSKDVVSFLAEIDLGLEWQFSLRWSAMVGYRLTLATGMGLADHQIPPYVVDTPELADIDYNGYLLLHGGFVGVTYRF